MIAKLIKIKVFIIEKINNAVIKTIIIEVIKCFLHTASFIAFPSPSLNIGGSRYACKGATMNPAAGKR